MSLRVTVRVTAVARKRPRSHCQQFRWKVTVKHAHILDPTKSEWANHAVLAQCGNHQGNKLTCNSSGNARPQSSQLAEPLWTNPWSERVELVFSGWSRNKERKRAGGEWLAELASIVLAWKKKPLPPSQPYVKTISQSHLQTQSDNMGNPTDM